MSIKKRKPGRPKKKHAGGRPPKMNAEVLAKLERAFLIGCTDSEACLVADISVDVLYRYQQANPGYSERKALLKKTPTYKARAKIVSEIGKDVGTAKWYIERKETEFSLTQKIEAEIKAEHGISPALEDMFNKIYGGNTNG